MAFSNLSFETAGASAGLAASWTVTSYSARDARQFNTELDYAEGFEREWNSNEDYLFAFDTGDLASNDFTTLTGIPHKTVENFEEQWLDNQTYVYGISGAVAVFDVAEQGFEDFEEEWDSNEGYLFAFTGGDLTAMTFANTTGTDDLESGWDTNESYLFEFVGVGTDLTANLFDAGVYAFEDFEVTGLGWPSMTSI